MKHKTVYSEKNRFAGWPANHGAWQWGDEFLVGFLEGPWTNKSMHCIGHPYYKMFARSYDGGYTWSVNPAKYEFYADDFDLRKPVDLDFSKAIRFCGSYDHGGEFAQKGGFYISNDRGNNWEGPLDCSGQWIDEKYHIVTSRTAYFQNGMAFFSVRKNKWGTDRTVCTKWNGDKFVFMSYVGDDSARSVMPAISKSDFLFCAIRRRKTRRCWIELYKSKNGFSWESIGIVSETGKNNGNPPALITLNDGRILCTWANRTYRGIFGRTVDPFSNKFSDIFCIRDGGISDIGYPRIMMRSDGTPVCIYYWADRNNKYQRIECTHISI